MRTFLLVVLISCLSLTIVSSAPLLKGTDADGPGDDAESEGNKGTSSDKSNDQPSPAGDENEEKVKKPEGEEGNFVEPNGKGNGSPLGGGSGSKSGTTSSSDSSSDKPKDESAFAGDNKEGGNGSSSTGGTQEKKEDKSEKTFDSSGSTGGTENKDDQKSVSPQTNPQKKPEGEEGNFVEPNGKGNGSPLGGGSGKSGTTSSSDSSMDKLEEGDNFALADAKKGGEKDDASGNPQEGGPEDKKDDKKDDKDGRTGGSSSKDKDGDKDGDKGSTRSTIFKREKANEKSCKYNDKTVEHGKQAYEDVCGKLECRDGNLAWYFWPNADYFEECHVPAPLSHGHRQHAIGDIPVHGDFKHTHALGLPLQHGFPAAHEGGDHMHLTPNTHHGSLPVNVHIDHVHHPEHHHPVAAPVMMHDDHHVDHHVDHAHAQHAGGYDVFPGQDTHAGGYGHGGAGHAPLGYGF